MSVILKAPIDQVGTPTKSNPQVVETVSRVLDDIRRTATQPVREYSEKFDRWSPEPSGSSADAIAQDRRRAARR